jgi:hypothetical protein
MSVREELIELEGAFWRAGGDPGFYRDRFADDGVMAFNVGIMTKHQILDVVDRAIPWERFTIDNPRFVALTDDVTSLTYTTTAKATGSLEEYRAAVTSVYVQREGTWVLILHQQTPLQSI